jgi:hypothetical protein
MIAARASVSTELSNRATAAIRSANRTLARRSNAMLASPRY